MRLDLADHRALARLAGPLAATQLLAVALSTTDVVMMGALGATALAAGGLAIALFNQVRTMGVGLLTSTGNRIAAATARADDAGAAAPARAALVLATLSGLLGAVVLVALGVALPVLGQTEDVADQGLAMALALAPGLVPCLWFAALRQVTVGLERPQRLLPITLASVGLNVVLNLALVHGAGPLPEMGLPGIGAATSLVHLATAVALWWSVRRDPVLSGALTTAVPTSDVRREMRELVRLGVPTSLTYGSEAGLFSVLALVAGSFGATALAAHNVVNQATYIVFQVAVGLSHAVSVKVSAAEARQDLPAARRWAVVAVQQAWAIVAVVGLVYLLVPDVVTRLLAPGATAATLATTATLLAVCAVNQLADSAQNLAVGLLRGLHRTGDSFRLSLIGYWGVGLPVALALAYPAGLEVAGVWIGIGAGLAATAALMMQRFRRLTAT